MSAAVANRFGEFERSKRFVARFMGFLRAAPRSRAALRWLSQLNYRPRSKARQR